jgi:acyl-CoA dehydrogenase family member 9
MGSKLNSSGLNVAGSVAKSLYLGNILEENLFPFPKISAAESETLRMVLDSIDKFMSPKRELYRSYDEKGVQPEEYIQELRNLGLFGLIIPEEHDGLGLSNAGYSRVLQQTSRYDASTSLTIGAHSSIGLKGLLLFGSPDQKSRYLSKLASGEIIAAFCLTEPGAGSDAASIKTHAEKQADGSWLLNGEKLWITNGPLADFFTVFARTNSEAGKISAFIVERGFGGVSHGPKEDKLGIRASATSTVRFENVKVPAANLLGDEGAGFKVAMSILNNGRTGLGGGSVGAMKQCIEFAAHQANERKQFGRPIAEFQLVKEKFAQMTTQCFVTESVVQMVAHYIDSGVEDYSIEAAMSKVFASESLWSVANEALQVAGGNGFMKDFPYERVVRDSRINMIFEGTNEILRLYIGLSGMKDAGEYLKDIRRSASKIFNDPIKGFGVLSSFAARKVTHLTTLGRDRMEFVHPALRDQAAIFETFTVRLSRAVDNVLMRLGKDIIGQQFVTKRLADLSTDLFAGLCTLSRVSSMLEERGPEGCSAELKIAQIFTQHAKRRMNYQLRRLLSNEDEEVKALADFILERRSYPWDIF